MLQDLVDFANHRGLKGLETLAGIPGWVGAAVYGNAGAYGHSISERVAARALFRWRSACACSTTAQCEFRYRESIFKRHKEWIIFRVELTLEPAPAAELQQISADILKVRNEKFPPTMKCAGSIFKNFLLRELPPAVAAAGAGRGGARGQDSGRLVSGAGGRQGHAGGRHSRGCVSRQSDLQCGSGHGAANSAS